MRILCPGFKVATGPGPVKFMQDQLELYWVVGPVDQSHFLASLFTNFPVNIQIFKDLFLTCDSK